MSNVSDDRSDRSLGLYEEGRSALAAGDYVQAIQALSASVLESPHHKSLELLGEALLRDGRPIEAIPPLAAAATLNVNVRSLLLLTRAFIELGQTADAENAVRQALARNPKSTEAKRLLSQCISERSR